jgi:hypothetical protein
LEGHLLASLARSFFSLRLLPLDCVEGKHSRRVNEHKHGYVTEDIVPTCPAAHHHETGRKQVTGKYGSDITNRRDDGQAQACMARMGNNPDPGPCLLGREMMLTNAVA